MLIPHVTLRPGVSAAGVGSGSQNYNEITSMLQYIIKKDSETNSSSNTQNLQQLYFDLIKGSPTTTHQILGKRSISNGSKPVTSIYNKFPKKNWTN